jgi:hypothetical protein
MYKTVARLRHRKQLISVSIIEYATEEHVTSVVTTRDSWRAAGSGVAMRSVTTRTVPLQWNTWYHTTHINRGKVFSVESAPRLYQSTDGTEMNWSSWESTVVGQSPAGKNVSMEAEGIVGCHYQATCEDWENLNMCCSEELQCVN